jgi:hypothetical protein
MRTPFDGLRKLPRKLNQVITLLAAVVVGAELWAQESSSQKPTDPYKVLAADAGTWDAAVKMYFQGPNGPATESSGIETSELVSGGKYSRTTFKYKMRNREFEGHGLIGYDPRSKKYVGTWVDNFTTIPSQIQGTYDSTAKTLTIHNTVADPSGSGIKTKQVTTFVDDKTKRLEIFMIVEDGGKTQEIKLMQMTAKKRS